VSDLQQAGQKSQDLATQQEKVMADWHAAQQGDLNKWHVAEAQYLVKLANDHLQFSHDVNLALILLQQADATLQNSQDPNLLDIRKAVAADVANLQNLPSVDVTALYTRVTALDAEVDQLPLPKSPLKTDENAPIVVAKDLPWWKAGMEYAWQGLNKIVIVRKNVNGVLPLVLPEEKMFLYQNLHAQLEDVIWSILQRNQTIYQASLARLMAWIPLYFDQDAQATKTFVQALVELQKSNIQPATVNLADTMNLFDQYLQTNQPKVG
jgi:uroporphyrin-3 C-methyltransferase